jgi:aldose 1-epimerase
MTTRTSGYPRPHVAREHFAVTPDGRTVDLITLTNAGGTEVRFLTYGGVILSILAADRDGVLDDVTLGYDTLDGYLADTRYFGALVGRYANRIAGGRFTLDGREHTLATNDGPNHLHGGPRGFHTAVWNAEPFAGDGGVGAILRHASPDGDEGYPGALQVRVTYTLTDEDDLEIDYHATTDAPTVVNLTQHAYFNLAGHDAGDVLGHELTLPGSRFAPVDSTLIPTGELRDVRGTPFDFTTPTAIGARIDGDDEQLRRGQGYDHNWVLDREPGSDALLLAARLREPRSGRVMEVYTTEPGIQFYSGNVLPGGPLGKGGVDYVRRGGLALETQHFPDSPNRPEFPSAVVRPGEAYRSRTVYRFLVD